jgi:hypothetical protein
MTDPKGEPSAPFASPREGLAERLRTWARGIRGAAGLADDLREAAQSLEALSRPKVKIGELRVDVYFGLSDHHVSGEMGLYPWGVTTILKAVHDALDEHHRLSALLGDRETRQE